MILWPLEYSQVVNIKISSEISILSFLALFSVCALFASSFWQCPVMLKCWVSTKWLNCYGILRWCETCNALQLPVFFFFFFSYFCQPYPRLRNFKSVFLILKISQYGGSMRWGQLFPRYSCKNWYLYFYKTYDHQIWQAGTSRGFDSN